MDEVVLVTRKANQNKGNLALSAAWARLLRQAFPGAAVRTLERAPRYLARFTLRGLSAQTDPVAAFEEIAGRLAGLAPGPDGVGPPGGLGIVLDESEKPFAKLRKRLKLRRLAAWSGVDQRAYRRRLAAFQRAGLVVMNPAGEFHPGATDIALMYLLDMRAAQKLGCRTAMVNLSLETVDPALSPLIRHVFSKVDFLHLRDEESRSAYVALGGDPSQAVVVPDLALATPAPRGVTARPGVIGLAVNGERKGAAGELDEWVRLISLLQAQGLEVVLVSNAVPRDRPYYQRLQAKTGVDFVSEGLDFQPFTELLASFEQVVTMRMHTGILALAAGRPVIPVEPALFKMAGLFGQLGFTATPVRTSADGWVEDIVRRVGETRSNLAEAEAETRRRVSEVVERSQAALIPRLKAAASAPA